MLVQPTHVPVSPEALHQPWKTTGQCVDLSALSSYGDTALPSPWLSCGSMAPAAGDPASEGH